MHGCPCGFFNDSTRECSCSPVSIKKYLSRISGPLLDRIDIHIEVYPLKYDDLENEKQGVDSKQIKARVNKARQIQIGRYKGSNIYCNAQLTPAMMKRYCKLDDESKRLLKSAFEKLGLSARAYNKVLKISRTIADIDGSESIRMNDVAEAIQYRSMDKKYWENSV